ncbi:MAG: AI-2E family transporter [Nitrospirae bacterium]|nr:MAG: AI-2E family transporter [Nitrospirota bacterium]
MTKFTSLLPVAIITLLGYLTYQIFSPFLTAIAWAVVFCVIFYPVHHFLMKYTRFASLASGITILLIVALIIGPLSYMSFALVSEVTDLVTMTDRGEGSIFEKILSDSRVLGLINSIGPYTGISEGSAREFLIEGGKKLGQGSLEHLSAGFSNMVQVAVNFVLMLFTVFFLFRDGTRLADWVRDWLPFPDEQKDRLFGQTKDLIVSTIYGGVVVALSQGILGGIAFAIFGIGAPVLWGSVMALCSFLPAIGTALVWAPASLFLFIQGAYLKALGLVLVGVFVIGMVDNILRPLIIGSRIKMPAIIIFFAVMGGIKFFGLLGLILGPLVFTLFISIFGILRNMEAEKGGL